MVQKQAAKGIRRLSGEPGLDQEQQVARLTEAQRYLQSAQAALTLALNFAENRNFSEVLAAKKAKKDQQLAEFESTIGASSGYDPDLDEE